MRRDGDAGPVGRREPGDAADPQRVDDGVPDDADARRVDALALEEPRGQLGRREMRGRQRDHEPAVRLLHRQLVERPQAGFEVDDADTEAARGERDQRCGVGVTEHQHDVRSVRGQLGERGGQQRADPLALDAR
jgi:hypothetical protein